MDFLTRFDLIETLYIIPGIIIGFAFHEYAHAKVAEYFGDDTPRLLGRTTLNPLVHIDIVGFLMIIIAGFGWAKPVLVNPFNFRNRKRDDILVSLAGPAMNLVIALAFLLLMKIAYHVPATILDGRTYEILMNIFDNAVWINIVLMIFNLLPIPPLDGSHIFFGLANLKETAFYNTFSQYSTFMLLALIITDMIGKVIIPPVIAIYDGLFSIFFAL